ncbi:65-kDa microtubule-associated protein 5 [Apostasia shenzhenica]|uniref:65-kDa microtubule-associated protein 5 n=1 Tax=Apostasia shenzhenica TaxID=1088818 RepID=A0A2I0BGQ4_9ASPA|nr:65-kDa microtubule-associated protein 5 [Apostasia shenzhenica]
MTPRSQFPVPAQVEVTSCGSLLQELQVLWDEIGENELDRDRILLQLEKECLDVYRRKVDQERKHRADLIQVLAEGEVEVSKLISVLGEHGHSIQAERQMGTLKEQVARRKPLLDDLRRRREERLKEFLEVQLQIAQISAEISGNTISSGSLCPQVDEKDLTVKRLGELKCQLLELQKEKNMRIEKVSAHIKMIHELCNMLAVDCSKMIHEIHPDFGDCANTKPMSVSNDTLARLTETIHSLTQEKNQRLLKLQGLGSTLIELWNLMEIPTTERSTYEHISSLISASADEALGHECLAMDIIEQAELEVARLNVLKTNKMKELVLKRQNQLEEIYKGVHMDFDSDTTRKKLINIINSGKANLCELLADIDNQISMAQEVAASRKDILERLERWRFACQEESWLEEYERDNNRYSAGRGTHINLKRAEKARILISKIPSLVEILTAKVKSWESDKRMQFLLDKKSVLQILEEYTVMRKQREEEKRQSREHKKSQEQYATSQEVLFGSKPSPVRQQLLAKKPLAQSNLNMLGGTPANRRFSTQLSRSVISSNTKEKREGSKLSSASPLNYVALAKDC